MAADALAMPWVSASAAMILTYFSLGYHLNDHLEFVGQLARQTNH